MGPAPLSFKHALFTNRIKPVSPDSPPPHLPSHFHILPNWCPTPPQLPSEFSLDLFRIVYSLSLMEWFHSLLLLYLYFHTWHQSVLLLLRYLPTWFHGTVRDSYGKLRSWHPVPSLWQIEGGRVEAMIDFLFFLELFSLTHYFVKKIHPTYFFDLFFNIHHNLLYPTNLRNYVDIILITLSVKNTNPIIVLIKVIQRFIDQML